MSELQDMLTMIKRDISLAKNYSGRIRGNNFYPCKKCGGRGYREYTMPARREICQCVIASLRDFND